MTDKGIAGPIPSKALPGKALVHWKKWFNKAAPVVRSGVERANGTMKPWYGMGRVRYRGLKRNHCHLQFVSRR